MLAAADVYDGIDEKNNSEEGVIREIVNCRNKKERVIKTQTEEGWRLIHEAGCKRIFRYENEPEISDYLRCFITHKTQDPFEREIQFYSWDLKKIEEATEETFGTFRILIKSMDNGFKWYSSNKKIKMFSSLEEARKAVQRLKKEAPFNQYWVI